MSFIYEIIVEVVLEFIFEFVASFYINLMTLIVPDKVKTEQSADKIKFGVKIVAGILAIVLIIGVLMLLAGDSFIKSIGKYLTYIPLGIIIIQIVLGIALKLIKRSER